MNPILPAALLDSLRAPLAEHFGSADVTDALGLAGQAALGRGDLAGADRVTRDRDDATSHLIRLFMLGRPVHTDAIRHLIAVDEALEHGLLVADGRSVRACFDLRPYGETDADWWVLSDLGADVRSGPLPAEHVLGIGTAATTLAQATVRPRAESALDVGTGCGVQALHLSRNADRVTATDLSGRALAFAAANAAINGLEWDLREGSLLDPVAGEEFDLVVCNPPFIVGPGFTPGADGYRYRDSGLGGDDVSRALITGIPRHLRPGGHGQLLANWEIRADEEWPERIGRWLAGSGCDAWVWQREVAEPGEYIALWLRDAGEQPGTGRWRELYNRWADWFTASGVIAVGMGLVSLRRTDAKDPVLVCEDVVQPVEPPIGREIQAWLHRARWLAEVDSTMTSRLRRAPDLVLTSDALAGPDGWEDARLRIRQSHGMRWDLETDRTVAGVLAALPEHPAPAGLDLSTVITLLASAIGVDGASLAAEFEPIARDLVQRGFLLPEEEA